jgi:hypothetical protein
MLFPRFLKSGNLIKIVHLTITASLSEKHLFAPVVKRFTKNAKVYFSM